MTFDFDESRLERADQFAEFLKGRSAVDSCCSVKEFKRLAIEAPVAGRNACHGRLPANRELGERFPCFEPDYRMAMCRSG